MKKIIAKKGYTLEVTSWENDADNYRTKSVTFNTKAEALAVLHLFNTVFVSCHNGDGGIGNLMYDDDNTAKRIISSYFIKNPKLLEIGSIPLITNEMIISEYTEELFQDGPQVDWNDWREEYIETHEELKETWNEFAMHYNWELMGGSEHYYSRVFESSELFYNPENVYAESVDTSEPILEDTTQTRIITYTVSFEVEETLEFDPKNWDDDIQTMDEYQAYEMNSKKEYSEDMFYILNNCNYKISNVKSIK